VIENLKVIRAIEDKIYNHHDFSDNLRLALRPVGRLTIRPGTLQRGPRDLIE